MMLSMKKKTYIVSAFLGVLCTILLLQLGFNGSTENFLAALRWKSVGSFTLNAPTVQCVNNQSIITLSWSVSKNADAYSVERMPSSGSWRTISSGLSSQTFMDSSLGSATGAFNYRVKSSNYRSKVFSNTQQVILAGCYAVPVTPTPIPVSSNYPLHKNITATVFWVGEPIGNGSSEDNSISAWDDTWEADYGGYDDYSYIRTAANNYFPTAFIPKENPFYLDLPYNDYTNNGNRKTNAMTVVPWANTKTWGPYESMLKNQWVKLIRNGMTCYGQIEDSGPYQYDDYLYVFGDGSIQPKSKLANNAGLDVSPALRDCLQFQGLNNADNKVDWQFVNFADVPNGPWKQIITTSQINWP